MTDNVEGSVALATNAPASKKAAQPRPKASEKARTSRNQYQLPNKLRAPNPSKYPLYTPTRIYLPDKVIPEKSHIHILTQGNEGSAVGVALADLINYLTSRQGKLYHASPRMIYEVAKTYDGTGDQPDPGAKLSSALYGLTTFGVANETVWPYIPNKPDRQLTPERSEAAKQFKIKSFAQIPKDKDTLRTAIVEHGAIVCGAMAHEGWMKAPISTIPFTGNEIILGGIAFTILGYTPQGFIIQLDWSTTDVSINLEGQDFPGLAIWTYPDFEKNFSDAWVVELPEGEQKIARALRAGYTGDNATATKISDDQLNVMPDVRAICSLLAARDIQPPLALGLFGNWGTGKSFFMRLMQIEIEHLAAAASKSLGKTPFYERIVQIEFNAWHFLDTNLWASLVSEIFSRLHDQISASVELPEEHKKELFKRLGQAEGIYRQSKLEYEDAQRAQQAAQQAAQAATEEVEREKQRLHVFQEIEQKSNLVAKAFRTPELAKSASTLADTARMLESTSSRLLKIWKMVWQSPDRWKFLSRLAVMLLGPLLLGWLAVLLAPILPGALHQLSQSVVTVLGFLATLGGWLVPRLVQFNNGISALENAASQIKENPEVKDQKIVEIQSSIKDSLEQSQKKETQARTKLDEAEKNVADVQQELARLNPRWQMQQFIFDRSGSEDYSKQLGLISLIRRDFEKLSQLLRENQVEEQKLQEASDARGEAADAQAARAPAALPFQRIILYIDDLDRCSPERVVDVLEAVHLLLAFPLFIVVVAVDPRWLRTCLEIRYKDLLMKNEARAGEDARIDQTATPQDYLEKIFQIPFYLRPLSSSNFTTMVQGLLGAEVASGEQNNPTLSTGQFLQAGGPADAAKKPGDKQTSSTRNTGSSGRAVEPETGENAPEIKPSDNEEINPDRLKLEKIELDDTLQLSPFFRTPRAVKRFINTYRLVRVGIRPEALNDFISGNSEGVILHRVAMVLLAVVAGYPNLAPHFLHKLLDQMRSPQPALSWTSFLETCRKNGPVVRPSAPPQTDPTSADDEESDSLAAEWQGLCDALSSVSRDGFLPEVLSAYYDLVPPVARFSFSVSDLPNLRKK